MVAEPKPQPPAPTSPTTSTEGQANASSGEVKDALREAAQAPKSMMGAAPTTSSSTTASLESLQRQLDELRLKALRVSEESAVMKKNQRVPLDERVNGESIPTLIDSGATHILRQPRDEHELASATKVMVTLANDEKHNLLQAESGAILSTSPDTQPILPMAELVRAGCEVTWKRGMFRVVHPVWGELKTSLKGGCPELAQEQAAKLVSEIEERKLSEFKEGISLLMAKLDYLVREEKLPWTSYVAT